MYPQSELNRLAARKAGLRLTIATRRRLALAAAREVARPLDWIDAGWDFVRRHAGWAPAAVVSAGVLWRRGGRGRLGRLLHWAPTVLQLVRRVRGNG